MTTRMRARSRRAASSAPVSDPIARIELSRPYPSAPRPNSTAIVEAKIGKFMPNAPTRKTIDEHDHEVGSPRDVAEAVDELPRSSWRPRHPVQLHAG